MSTAPRTHFQHAAIGTARFIVRNDPQPDLLRTRSRRAKSAADEKCGNRARRLGETSGRRWRAARQVLDSSWRIDHGEAVDRTPPTDEATDLADSVKGKQMIHTVEAVVDESGHVRLLEDVRLSEARRALVTILEEPPIVCNETALLSEAALSDWNRPEEDAAWSHLQPAP